MRGWTTTIAEADGNDLDDDSVDDDDVDEDLDDDCSQTCVAVAMR